MGFVNSPKECKRVQRNCFSLFCLSPIIADGFARINPPNYLTVTLVAQNNDKKKKRAN